MGETTQLRAPELSVQLFDKDKFKVIEITLPIPDLLGEVDEHGKEQKLSARDSIECSLQKYQSIRIMERSVATVICLCLLAEDNEVQHAK